MHHAKTVACLASVAGSRTLYLDRTWDHAGGPRSGGHATAQQRGDSM